MALERIEGGTSANNLTKLIISFLKDNGGLSREDIHAKLLYFGAVGASVFQGNCNGVTVQLVREFAPYLLGIYYCGHRLNLVVQSLIESNIVNQMKAVLTALHALLCKVTEESFRVLKPC